MAKTKRKPIGVLDHQSAMNEDEHSWLETECGLDARHVETTSAQCTITVELTVRLDEAPLGYAPRLVGEAITETMVQRAMVMLVFHSLRRRGETLLDGRQISSPAHAVQWLLEQCAASLPSGVLDDMLQSLVG